MTNIKDITEKRLKEIILTKAIDCFIHNDLLVVDIPERMVIKNVSNINRYVELFEEKLIVAKDRESIKVKHTKYSDYEITLIKLNYNDVDFLVEKLGRTRKAILEKIGRMKEQNIIQEIAPDCKKKLDKILDSIIESKATLEDKTKIFLEIGRNFKGENLWKCKEDLLNTTEY